MFHEPHITEAKKQEINRIKDLVNEYSVVGLANIEKVPAKALHNLRSTLRGDVVITMAKIKLVKKAFKDLKKENLLELLNQIKGISALLFTNMNPIKLAQFLESKAVKGRAKPGDIAPIEILVKAGDTKLAPGPIISELNQNLKCPTLIKDGTIHIRKDTISHKVGDIIDEKQAQLLGRLGIEPMTIKLDFYLAWEDGSLISDDVLHVNIEAILNNVKLGASQAINLALSVGIITDETVGLLIGKAAREAISVAMELPIFIPDLLENYVSKATQQANALNASAFGLDSSEENVGKKDDKSDEEVEEESSDDDNEMGAGISALFG